jgi:hypothetical protein
MALNFPSSPTIGQVYTDITSGFSYEWDGTVWISKYAGIDRLQIIDDISSQFDNLQNTFNLTISSIAFTPSNAQQLRIVLGGVVQSPTVDYNISGSTIIFTTPPQTGLSFSGVWFRI